MACSNGRPPSETDLIPHALERFSVELQKQEETLTELADVIRELTNLVEESVKAGMKRNDLLAKLIEVLPDILGQEIAKLITSRSS